MKEMKDLKSSRKQYKTRHSICPICFCNTKSCNCLFKIDQNYAVCSKCGIFILLKNIGRHQKSGHCDINSINLKKGYYLIVQMDNGVTKINNLIKNGLMLFDSEKTYNVWKHIEYQYILDNDSKLVSPMKDELVPLEIELLPNRINSLKLEENPETSCLIVLSSQSDRNLTKFVKKQLNQSHFFKNSEGFLAFVNAPLTSSTIQTENQPYYIPNYEINLDRIDSDWVKQITSFFRVKQKVNIRVTDYSVFYESFYSTKLNIKYRKMVPESDITELKNKQICNFCGKKFTTSAVRYHEMCCELRNDKYFLQENNTGSIIVVATVTSMKLMASYFVSWIRFYYPNVILSFMVESDWKKIINKISLLSWNHEKDPKPYVLFAFLQDIDNIAISDLNWNEYLSIFYCMSKDPERDIVKCKKPSDCNKEIRYMCFDKIDAIHDICDFKHFPDIKSCFLNTQ